MEYIQNYPKYIQDNLEYFLLHPSGPTHILSLITYLPLLGAVIIALFLPRGNQRAPKVVATITTVLTFVLSLVMLSHFQGGTHKLQLVEYASWIPSIGVSYFLGVDGISILLVLLTTLLSVIVVVCSYSQIEENENAYYACLFLETGMLGVFVALDFFLFYIFWEIMLVPMYFLIGVWGHGRRLYSAIKFFLYTLFGSVFMLLGILRSTFSTEIPIMELEAHL
jgi:NADH-quinone oxidoreductase subunit M